MTPALGSEPFGIVASRLRTDEKRILEAMDRRGVAYAYLDSRTLWHTLQQHRPERKQIVLNREIGQARAAAAARALEAAAALVVNSAQAIETCGDKYRSSVALRDAGLPTPVTVLALTPDAALDALESIGYPAVVKPLVGSWGRRVARLRDREGAEAVLEHIAALPSPAAHIVYLQKYISGPDRDIRAIVIGDEPIGAAYRRGPGWRHNVARGADMTAFPPSPELADLAVMATRAVGADIAGVDLIEDSDGRLHVLEVNHGVEFSGFQESLGDRVSVAERIVDHLVTRHRSCSG
ncbi:RimK family alpha-L-glutamate ligase [Streptosporangium sp. CA-115845]|uniref:RimK family alpha-L-glutamate ligase n=1 Tax=Streptosporangium sp. CA-115845 TaxID=3240071 RepID=UPI003D9050D3